MKQRMNRKVFVLAASCCLLSGGAAAIPGSGLHAKTKSATEPGPTPVGVVLIGKHEFARVPGLPNNREYNAMGRARRIAGRLNALLAHGGTRAKDLSVKLINGEYVVAVPKSIVPTGYVITADLHYSAQNGVPSQKLAMNLKDSLWQIIQNPRVASSTDDGYNLGEPPGVKDYKAGLAAYDKNNLEDAEKAFKRAIGAIPNYWIAHVDLCCVQVQRHETDAARSTLKNLLESVLDINKELDPQSLEKVANLKKQLGFP